MKARNREGKEEMSNYLAEYSDGNDQNQKYHVKEDIYGELYCNCSTWKARKHCEHIIRYYLSKFLKGLANIIILFVSVALASILLIGISYFIINNPKIFWLIFFIIPLFFIQ